MRFTSRFKENAATVGNGLLFAVALTTPVVLGVAFQAFSLVSAASFGAMFALLIAPRHGALARVVGISAGGLLIVLGRRPGHCPGKAGTTLCWFCFSCSAGWRPCPDRIRPIWA